MIERVVRDIRANLQHELPHDGGRSRDPTRRRELVRSFSLTYVAFDVHAGVVWSLCLACMFPSCYLYAEPKIVKIYMRGETYLKHFKGQMIVLCPYRVNTQARHKIESTVKKFKRVTRAGTGFTQTTWLSEV